MSRNTICKIPLLALWCLILGLSVNAANAADGDKPSTGVQILKTATLSGYSSGPEQLSGPAGKPALGVYDPADVLSNNKSVAIEHVFVYWQALDTEHLRRKIAYAATRGRRLLVTVEPYTRAENWRDGGEHLFEQIVQGAFDKEISTICGELSTIARPPLVRWGHEMEDPNGRYPWARHNSAGYRKAFRHFVHRCRGHLPRARFVWSPKGEANLQNYYPGDAHVDLIGLSVWGLQTWDRQLYGRDRSFVEVFGAKYRRVLALNKPVIIAELGIAGSASYRQAWLFDLARLSSSPFERLQAVVYFNDKEPYHWPLGHGSPDWRIGAFDELAR